MNCDQSSSRSRQSVQFTPRVHTLGHISVPFQLGSVKKPMSILPHGSCRFYRAHLVYNLSSALDRGKQRVDARDNAIRGATGREMGGVSTKNYRQWQSTMLYAINNSVVMRHGKG